MIMKNLSVRRPYAAEVGAVRARPSVPGLLSWLFLLFVAFALAGCAGSEDNAAEGDGEIVIGLTDAEGDFINYEVDVLSIKLTKENGAQIETLPVSTRVDFAQYVDMTEFVTVATIPAGLYTHATLLLDYSNANIQVEDASGNAVAVPLGNIVDSNGAAISTLEAAVKLDDRRALLIMPGVPAHLTLDFDLPASNKVDSTQSPPIVTVDPFMLADVDPKKPKIHRLRGPLASVNTTNETFKISIRPFHHRMDNHNHDFGRINVVPDSATFYEINEIGRAHV